MQILIIIEIANDNDRKKVFNIIIIRIKYDKPWMLLSHCFINFPAKIRGIKLKKIKIKGMISVKSKALIEYINANINFARGSKLWMNESFFMNLKALRNSKDI